MEYFIFDRLVEEKDFCNYTKEREDLLAHAEKGHCVRIFGPRNYGKTSLVKNIVAKKWEAGNPAQRIVLYVDFYSVESLDDVSEEITQTFSKGLAQKTKPFQKGVQWIKSLSKMSVIWKPSGDGSDLGEFSLRGDSEGGTVDFEIVLENINNLQKTKKFQFFLILDEFQEISRIGKAEGKLRGALQKLSGDLPVFILGSKYHLLKKVFSDPRAPFFNWGVSLELKTIPYDEFTNYINLRFRPQGKNISKEASVELQDVLGRNPEAINRFCAFLLSEFPESKITLEDICTYLEYFLDSSRAIYADQLARLSSSERKVVLAIVHNEPTKAIHSKKFIEASCGLSKSGITTIVERLLNNSVIYRRDVQGESFYEIADPLFRLFLKKPNK